MSEHRDKVIKYEFRVFRTAAGLRMELGREERFCAVAYSFVGAVVHIYEMRFPVGRYSVVVYRESVVLAGYEAALGAGQAHRLVVRAMTVL